MLVFAYMTMFGHYYAYSNLCCSVWFYYDSELILQVPHPKCMLLHEAVSRSLKIGRPISIFHFLSDLKTSFVSVILHVSFPHFPCLLIAGSILIVSFLMTALFVLLLVFCHEHDVF